jgi:hypothetical protein
MLAIEVKEKLVEGHESMGPDRQDVVNIAVPVGRLQWGSKNSPFFKIFHEQVGNQGAQPTAHGGSVHLLVKLTGVLEEIICEAITDQLDGIFGYFVAFFKDVHCIRYWYFRKK